MFQTPLTDSVDLYNALRRGDRRAQEEAYRALWPYLLRVAHQVARDQPDAEALAQDCAQAALVKIHASLDEVNEPAAFKAWARRITTSRAIDELRRRRRLEVASDDDESDEPRELPAPDETPRVDAGLDEDELTRAIRRAPISDRSRRVVVGRYIDDRPDEELAQTEGALLGQTVLPSHIQVTRAKDIDKLRKWEPLRALLRPS
ncbi:MAG: RNA polymerase sigma factor [Anaerolineae bacterium]